MKTCPHSAVVALGVLPVTALLIPLLVRSRGWPVWTAGQMVGAQALGAGAVVAYVLLKNTSRRPGLALSAGVLVAGAAGCALAVTGSRVLAPAVCAIAGIGLGLFGTHVAPLVLAAAPGPYLSRIQAVLTLCQTLPLALGLSLDGLLAANLGIRATLLAAGVLVCATGVLAACARPIRAATIA
jgi:hypothetical protein